MNKVAEKGIPNMWKLVVAVFVVWVLAMVGTMWATHFTVDGGDQGGRHGAWKVA